MTNARKKVQLKRRDVNNWEEADKALKDIAVIDQTITKEEAHYNKDEQERRAKITAKHFPLRTEIQEIELGLEAFTVSHRSELGDKKSKTLKHGEVNFRVHPPSVTKSRGVTWAAVLDLVKASRKWAKKFIRTKEEVNKDAVIAAHNNSEIKDKELAAMGMAVEQKETFGYKTKLAVEGK